jgi:hypothetical protein
LAAVLGVTTFLALALQGPCLSSGYEQPSASARMCAGPLSTAFLGDTNPEVLGRAHGGGAALAPLEARLVDLVHLFTNDVSLFMVVVLLLNTAGIAALGAGLLVLARFRGWLVAVFASPLILFTLGSTLDPIALALAVWAMVESSSERLRCARALGWPVCSWASRRSSTRSPSSCSWP